VLSDNKEPGQSDDTTLLQVGIDHCARHGGGRLELAGRTYQIGPIELRSKVYLVLAPNTVLQATADKSQFERAFIGWPFHAREALISGHNISDSGILGTGRIDGQGVLWWEEARRQRKDGTMASMFPALPDANGMPRPWLVEFYDSRNITIDGPTLQNSPMWSLALRYVNQARVEHLTIRNPKEAPNTDGIDVVASQNINISHVDIATGDDNVTIKSGLAGFNVPAQAASDIHVSDAKFGVGHGFSIGSETLNGVNHVTLERVSFDGTTNGIRIKTGRDRGADISAIHARDITMNNVDTALSVIAYYPKFPAQRGDAVAVTATTPRVHDIRIDGMVATGSNTAGIFVGLPESPLRDVVLKSVRIQAAKGLMLRDAQVQADHLDLQVQDGKAIDQREEGSINQL